MSHLLSTLLLSPWSGETKAMRGSPTVSFPYLIFFPSIHFHSLSLLPTNGAGGVGYVCITSMKIYSLNCPKMKIKRNKIGEMVKCLRLVKSSQGAGSEKLDLL